MKIYVVLSFVIFLVLIFFPFTALTNSDKANTDIIDNVITTAQETDTNEISADEIRVLRVSSGKIENVDITEYLIGAVASEMPASFHEEALKAQAVACNTYIKWVLKNSDNTSEKLSDVSDSSSTHQGYLNTEELKEKWAEKYDTYYNKLKSVISEVKGQYLAYNNEPILAVFHAISPGTTNSASDVWGDDIPYLSSVSAPGDTLSAEYDSEVICTENEFKSIAEKNCSVTLAENEKENWITNIKTAESGYVTELSIGDTKFSGRDIRTYFSLKSPNFTVEYKNNNFVFAVYGKGHGVGMSQYSADFMARQGSDYKEILYHFYKDTVLQSE